MKILLVLACLASFAHSGVKPDALVKSSKIVNAYMEEHKEAVLGEEMVIFKYVSPDTYDEFYSKKDREIETNEIDQQPVKIPTNVTTTLFSWSHRAGIPISENNTLAELQSLVDSNVDMKFVVHGWLSSANATQVNNTIEVYLAERNLNAVAVDWSTLAGRKVYSMTTLSVVPVGRSVAKLVMKLVEAKVTSLDRIHLIGHSLGAHVMGVAGYTIHKEAGVKVSRITGLDPASPLYEHTRGSESQLDSGDAEFVDVIHTAGGIAGYYSPLGHVDFYPNGGTAFMPGCMELNVGAIACSHSMSYKYFDESISNPTGFMSVECADWSSFVNGSCDTNNSTYMGDPVPSRVRGVYYLKTNAEPPYSMGVEGAK